MYVLKYLQRYHIPYTWHTLTRTTTEYGNTQV